MTFRLIDTNDKQEVIDNMKEYYNIKNGHFDFICNKLNDREVDFMQHLLNDIFRQGMGTGV